MVKPQISYDCGLPPHELQSEDFELLNEKELDSSSSSEDEHVEAKKRRRAARSKRPQRLIKSWGLRENERIWNIFKCKGKGVKVAVLDTGVWGDHPDIKIVGSKDFSGSRYGVKDLCGHGTHCCGIIGSKNTKKVWCGIAPECELYAGKVLADNGRGSVEWIDKGIEWAISQGVDVISMSLGCEGKTAPIFAKTISKAIRNGIIVVVAGGNSGPYKNTVEAPGNFNPCITVGAVDQRHSIASFSSRGSQIDITAPGVKILSTYKNNKYAYLSGTSMATPYIAGVAALYISYIRENFDEAKQKEYINQQKFEHLLKMSATDLGKKGFDNSYGAGYVNITNLLKSIH